MCASLHACNAIIAAFPAVGHGGGPENEVGSVNIEPNYANELHKRLSCRDGLIGALLAGDPSPAPHCSVSEGSSREPGREAGAAMEL